MMWMDRKKKSNGTNASFYAIVPCIYILHMENVDILQRTIKQYTNHHLNKAAGGIITEKKHKLWIFYYTNLLYKLDSATKVCEQKLQYTGELRA